MLYASELALVNTNSDFTTGVLSADPREKTNINIGALYLEVTLSTKRILTEATISAQGIHLLCFCQDRVVVSTDYNTQSR